VRRSSRAAPLTRGARAHAACSSAFMALHDAVMDLQRGRVDYAVVGGSSAIFRPATSLAFLRLKCGPCPPLL